MRPVDIVRMLCLAGVWGASFLFMRIIAPVLGAIPTAFFRVLIAVIGLMVILALLRVKWNFEGKLKAVLILGVINSGLPATLYAVAAQVLPAGYSAIFNATTPLMGVLIGGLFFSEKLSATKLAGVFLGLFGVAVLTRAGPMAFDKDLLIGALACLLATTSYGFAGFLARRWLDQQGGLDPRLSALGSMFGATLFLLPLFAISLFNQPPADWGGARVWLSMLGLGLVCTAFAYILFFRLLTSIGPVKSMTVTFMIPPFGVLWGALFLGEPLSMAHVYGGLLIAMAVWLVLKPATVAK
ncbi:DMT family transporter [Pseudomonas psychrophila]|uniref:DMT family transporter n=1 Tax=Pseudomonas psychrophila TaxID=122355 RepID=UPI000309B35F|nr:DMT family transporter [Pseudomonas psychrophila]